MKSKKSAFDIFVWKITNSPDTIFHRKEIEKYWISAGGQEGRLAAAISRLLGMDILRAFSRDVYFLASDEDSLLQGDLFWSMLAAELRYYPLSRFLIIGESALTIALRDISPPDHIALLTPDTSARIRRKDGGMISLRTLSTGAKSGMKNVFPLLWRDRQEILLDGERFFLPSLECILLEALSGRIHDTWYSEERILRFLNLFWKKLDAKKIAELIRYKYIRALNRLRIITREHGYEDLYRITLDIIRKEGGGCYIWL